VVTALWEYMSGMPEDLMLVICTLVTGMQRFAREDLHIDIDHECVAAY